MSSLINKKIYDPLIGTAAWDIPKQFRQDLYDEKKSLLELYSLELNCTEINTSFYRQHQPKTYEKWCSLAPPQFKFSIKLLKDFTHNGGLNCDIELFKKVADQMNGLGGMFFSLLVQLPPSLLFDHKIAKRFFKMLKENLSVFIAFEPRNVSWLANDAQKLMSDFGISLVYPDPDPFLKPRSAAAKVQDPLPEDVENRNLQGHSYIEQPLLYLRLHGSPRIYFSIYGSDQLKTYSELLIKSQLMKTPSITIFDNTAAGHAFQNALSLKTILEKRLPS